MEQIPFYIATRKSALALWQANTTQSLLLKENVQCEIKPVVTIGDKIQHMQLSNVTLNENNIPKHLDTGKGLFIKEVQDLILKNEAHLAVHSMKDLPVTQTDGLVIGALLPRASPCDVLVLSPQVLHEAGLSNENQNYNLNSNTLENFINKLKKSNYFMTKPIGTTSLRRQLLMKKYFSENLNLQILRGNVDSRLKKVNDNQFSAILLAQAGLERLNIYQKNSMYSLPVSSFIPATAQGVVAIECARSNVKLIEILKKINCVKTCLQVSIERLILKFLEGDCNSSVGVHLEGSTIHILYGKNKDEKSCVLNLELNFMQKLENLYNLNGQNYSQYFEKLLKSELSNNLKLYVESALKL